MLADAALAPCLTGFFLGFFNLVLGSSSHKLLTSPLHARFTLALTRGYGFKQRSVEYLTHFILLVQLVNDRVITLKDLLVGIL